MRLRVQHPTSNIEHRTSNGFRVGRSLDVGRWMLDVGCSNSISSSPSFSPSSNFAGFLSRPGRNRGEAAFTLIEIAISLAIIAFALVAIIGVLPIGLNVQRDNREETIINHDATMLMDAIRSGARGFDDLTNYVFAITNFWQDFDDQTNLITGRPTPDWYTPTTAYVGGTTLPNFRLDNGERIIGLMSMPKRIPGDYTAPFRSNHVVVYMRSLSGPAAEKFPQTNSSVQELAFNYRLIPEVIRAPSDDWTSPYGRNLKENISDIRLLFRWPLLPTGDAGPSRQTYRSMAGGGMEVTNDAGQKLYFFRSTVYSNSVAPPNYTRPNAQ